MHRSIIILASIAILIIIGFLIIKLLPVFFGMVMDPFVLILSLFILGAAAYIMLRWSRNS